jgi:hypothetical protein
MRELDWFFTMRLRYADLDEYSVLILSLSLHVFGSHMGLGITL